MKFSFGDEVVLVPAMEPRVVVGITPVDNEALASAFSYQLGTILYTVEFGDGSDPEQQLRLAVD